MRKIFIVLFWLGRFAVAQDWPLIRTDTLFGSLESGIQLGARVSVQRAGTEIDYGYNYSVGQYLGMNYMSGRWLGSDASRPSWTGVSEGITINSASVEIGFPSSSFLGNWVVGLSGYVWGYEVIYYEPQPPVIATGLQTNFAPGRTNLLFGFKLFEDGNPDIAYYGWVELLRDQGDAVSQFRFGRHAVDYLPNRGIRAGREPERPSLVSVVTPETTTLSWDPFYVAHGFVLERSESLTPPVNWEPVEIPIGATNVVILNARASSALYRLARP
jgi:hypothetical protein